MSRSSTPTVRRVRTWRLDTSGPTVVERDGRNVTVDQRWTMRVYGHVFTLTRETWPQERLTGWWLAVDGQHATEQGARQQVSPRRLAAKDAVNLGEVRQIVGIIRTAWQATRVTVCEHCQQELATNGTCHFCD